MTAHYVYRCYDANGELLYVGATKDVPSRLGQHRAKSFWAVQAAKVRSRVYCDKETAHEVERLTIIREDPKYNIRSKPNARDRWTQQDFDDQIRKLATLTITHSARSQFDRLFEDYLDRFGQPHPLVAHMTLRFDAFDAQWAIERKEWEARQAEQHRAFKEREATENVRHFEHCCSCRFGIVVDDELVERYGNDFALDEQGEIQWPARKHPDVVAARR